MCMRTACTAFALALLLAAAPAWATTPPPPGYVDASTFGYNPTDATAALQSAINASQKVFVPNMGTNWIITPIQLQKDNQRILFESGVTVEAKRGEFSGNADSLFTARDNYNVSLTGYGATFLMHQADYMQAPYTPSEYRHAVRLIGVSEFTIEGVTIRDTGGDGVYIRGSTGYGKLLYSEGVTITNVRIDNAYRNGISVISSKDLLIDNSVITNNTGLDPRSGIDFERNGSDDINENFTVRNTVVNNNGRAGIMLVDNVGYPVSPYTGVIEDVTANTNGESGIHLNDCVFPGVTVKDSLIDSDSWGVGFKGMGDGRGAATGEPRNTIDYSNLFGNTGGATLGWVEQGTGTITSPAPEFYSTDINSPYYMYLAPSCSSLITHGASDGGYMGARPVYAFTLGDFNKDGAVDVSDLGILATNYGTTSGMTWGDGDANDDGAVDAIDLDILATNYGMGTAASGAVPEPAALSLILGAILTLGFFRRRPLSH